MGTSNMRKLKKKYKQEAVSGIKDLIELYKENDLNNTSDLEGILHFCENIKVGNFGKRIYRDDAGEAIHTDWKIKDDFRRFGEISKSSRRRFEWARERYSGSNYTQYMTEALVSLTNEVEKQIDKINERYRMEHRDVLIDSLLED
jgi:hypothetical protein